MKRSRTSSPSNKRRHAEYLPEKRKAPVQMPSTYHMPHPGKHPRGPPIFAPIPSNTNTDDNEPMAALSHASAHSLSKAPGFTHITWHPQPPKQAAGQTALVKRGVLWTRPQAGDVGSFWTRHVSVSPSGRNMCRFPASVATGLKVVYLFRSNYFGAARGRSMASKPAPGVVFDIVNDAIARKLAQEPLSIPTAADAMSCWLDSRGRDAPTPAHAGKRDRCDGGPE